MNAEILVTTGIGSVLAGAIELTSKGLNYVPVPGYENVMEEVLSASVYTVEGEQVTRDNPQQWLTNLPRIFSGGYLRVVLIP